MKWGWLSKDFDEKLNCYIIGFPEYSRLYVELFDRLEKEDDSMERESILSVYSALYTYDSDPEKNNSILKSALRTSKSLGQMLSNMQGSMRLWFDELSKRKDFIGIQEVLVNEINNRESVKYAILTTTDSFYRYKEAVKELIAKILEENENRREGLTAQKRMLMAAQGSDSSAPEPSESAGSSYAASMQAKALASGASAPALLRLERGIQFCEEAAQLVLLVEREFDLIEKKYNRLIELKTVFARRALARIHYLLQEGAGVEDSTLELIGLLNHGDKKEALLEELRDSMYVTAPFSIVGTRAFTTVGQGWKISSYRWLCRKRRPRKSRISSRSRSIPADSWRSSDSGIRRTEFFRFWRIRCSRQRIWKSFCLSGRRRPRADRRKTGFCCRRKSIRRTAFPTPVLV